MNEYFRSSLYSMCVVGANVMTITLRPRVAEPQVTKSTRRRPPQEYQSG